MFEPNSKYKSNKRQLRLCFANRLLSLYMVCVSIDTQTCCQDVGVIPIIIRRKLKTKQRILTLKWLTNLKSSTNYNEVNKCNLSFKINNAIFFSYKNHT